MLRSISFLAAGFLVLCIGSHSILAQVPTTESESELRIKQLEHQADSLKKEARRLKQSLHSKSWQKDLGKLSVNFDSLLSNFKSFTLGSDGNLFLDGDSVHLKLHAPDSTTLRGWTEGSPKNFPFEIPDLPQNGIFGRGPVDRLQILPEPKKEKKKAPVDGFKGWYIEELAELGE